MTDITIHHHVHIYHHDAQRPKKTKAKKEATPLTVEDYDRLIEENQKKLIDIINSLPEETVESCNLRSFLKK